MRFVAPSHDPYFLLGIGLIGYVAWLHGMLAGLATAVVLAPLTIYIYSQFNIAISYTSFASSPAYIGMEALAAVALGNLRKKTRLLEQRDNALAQANASLQAVLGKVKELGGVHSICTSCKMIQDDDGAWMRIDDYLLKKTKMEFSHALCPDCAPKYSGTPEKTAS
ncbi:hypothetical protein [Pontiella sulfatireligans]|uniref:Histidine kinase n=1 Tax=Pontiella sulfatireligans TaxID=2750658 RepID=A0A6C2UL93_9BACT|nr:hypothetical protein [Pontiella sulfatireligans]VGO20187.1 hypothetical protein SCARR_02248 [Pontiella sulfatireligans]